MEVNRYFEATAKDTYFKISTYTTGSYYDVMKSTVLQCIEEILLQHHQSDRGVLTIADFGTADGMNFSLLLGEILRTIGEKTSSTVQVMAYFNDIPNNNFNIIHRILDSSRSESNVFCASVGKSMYTQCLPSDSVDLAVSSTALNWLSKTPCIIKDGLNWTHCDQQELDLFKKQAREDWRDFLLSRGAELKNGGLMVILVPTCENDDILHGVYIQISQAWKRMYLQKKIAKDEYEKTTLNVYTNMTVRDIRVPFDDPDVCRLGLRLVSITTETHHLAPLISIKENSGKTAFTRALVDIFRPWLGDIILRGLSHDRQKSEGKYIVEEYFTVLYTLFLENSFYDLPAKFPQIQIKIRKHL